MDKPIVLGTGIKMAFILAIGLLFIIMYREYQPDEFI
jgi:hypothetical protein